MKKIAFVLDTCHGQVGGTELNTLLYAQELRRIGYDPIVVEVGLAILSGSTASDGLPIYNIKADHYDAVGFLEWRRFLAEASPSVVIRSKTWAGCINWKLDLVMFFSCVSYLSWEHHPAKKPDRYRVSAGCIKSDLFSNLKSRFKSLLREYIHFKTVDRSVAVSNAVRDPLIDFYPISESKIDVVYPGVDFDFFSHDPVARENLRNEWDVPGTSFVIGSLGRLVEHKGNDFTLRVVAELLRRNKKLNVWCVFAGKGPDLRRLQLLAEELGISDRVSFPGWQKDASSVWSVIDLFLMPSSDEGLGMTLIESVACGCLPLASSVGGITEILCGANKRYCLPLAEVGEWVDVVQRLVESSSYQRSAEHKVIYNDLHSRFSASEQWAAMTNWLER